MQACHLLTHLIPSGKNGMIGLVLAAGLAVSLFLSPQPPQTNIDQSGPIFTVNDLADPGGAACQVTACSLRAAVSAANAGSLPGGYTITFDLAYPAQITLGSSLPEISGTMAVIGPGKPALTISGSGLERIFTVQAAGALTLSGMTLSQGWNGIEGGGAIRNGGSLVLTNVIVSDNLAGGGDGGGLLNDNGGDVQISNSSFLNNVGFHDGAIANSGSITIHGSVFSGNRGRVAGAIENHSGSSMTIVGSAFTDNEAKISSGGAIANGGILVIANSTFFQNGSPTGADIVSGNTLYITNSTFFGAILPSFNSIATGGTGSVAVVRNSILAAADGVANCFPQMGGVFDVDATNLSTDASCGVATQVTPDQIKLGPLVDLGGVPGMVPLPGSPAVDAGDDSACAAAVGAPDYGAGGVDQRGMLRPMGVHCDIGAVEALPPVLYLPQILN
jgi:CSLREA domain-containing protein